MKRKMALENVIILPGTNAGILVAHLFFLVFK